MMRNLIKIFLDLNSAPSHTLPHISATRLNKAETDLDDIAMVGGWKSLDACTRDVKNSQDRAREVGARIDNFF